jgi:GH35 family endo-1,4-beta-xylanase
MQYCLKIVDGKIDFDFSALEKIADLARATGKKLVIDSAVVFGDRYPENMAHMSQQEIREAIAIYIRKLTQEFGKDIERIDVLNSVFQREKIDGIQCEEFWKKKLGEDYASEVLTIARDNSDNRNIKLGWNEFYLTHQGMPDRQKDFIERIKSLKGKLDVVGVQDNFRVSAEPEHIKHIEESLVRLVEEIRKLGINMTITELGCGVGGSNMKELGEIGTEGYQERLNVLNSRIKQLLYMVIDFAKKNNITVETRHSDKYDWNPKHGHEGIQTGLSREQLEIFLGKQYQESKMRDSIRGCPRDEYEKRRAEASKEWESQKARSTHYIDKQNEFCK